MGIKDFHPQEVSSFNSQSALSLQLSDNRNDKFSGLS